MVHRLDEAVVETSGGKAGALGSLLRAGLPVPDGFVVPLDAYRAAAGALAGPMPDAVRTAIAEGLERLGGPSVAVRSSADDEDTAEASAAGQHESVLAVRGPGPVAEAVRTCWASLRSDRALSYRAASGREQSEHRAMAVLVQRLVDAEVSGVMFTPSAPGGVTEIEASWGLGVTVVGGTVTPDAYRVDGDGSITRTVADKRVRVDRDGTRLVTRDVSSAARRTAALDDASVARLARLGREVAAVLGGPQDVEWAIVDGRIWILQARPITAALPAPSPARGASVSTATPTPTLVGAPGSRGVATGAARIVRGPGDFDRVRPGDILVCPSTDPAWTPLLRVAAGVVTETGGVLSHAAIVARELRIPAVLGVPDVTGRLRDGTVVTLDGAAGTVAIARASTASSASATRYLYVTRHGDADPFGRLTQAGQEQAGLLGERLASVQLDAVWHSPLPRAADSAQEIAARLRPGTPVAEAAELVDHVPYVPAPEEMPASWVPFFDGYDADEAESGHRAARGLIARFAATPDPAEHDGDVHELLVTHAYPIAWLVRHALDAPDARWLGLSSANTALTLIEYRPGLPPGVVMFNDLSHLPNRLRWTGFRGPARP